MAQHVEFRNECFVIAPIGTRNSPERRRSDLILDHVIRPAVTQLELVPVRADQIAAPGQITSHVVEHLLNARAAIADLTGANPNVYYELAVRHTARLPVVLIAEDGERLPFDLAQMRTIFLDHTDLGSAAACTLAITEQLRRALDGAVDSPISASVDLQGARLEGTRTERLLGVLSEQVETLSADVRRALTDEQPDEPAPLRHLEPVHTRRTTIEIEPTDPDDPVVLKASGVLDLYVGPELKERVLALADAGRDVIVDMSQATEIDSTTLGVLVGGIKRLRPRNKEIAVVAPPDIAKIFEVTGLDRVFLMAPDVDTARMQLRGSREARNSPGPD